MRPHPTRRASRPAGHFLDTRLDLLLATAEPVAAPSRRSRAATVAAGLVAAVAMGLVIGAALVPATLASSGTLNAAVGYWDDLPGQLPAQPVPTRSRILAADGSLVAEFFSENRVTVTSQEIPQVVKDAIVAIEDERFYDHAGVDVEGIGRAAAINALSDATQGGSTLTQQYVKNVLAAAAESDEARQAVTSRTSYTRKLREAKLAIEVEKAMTKDEILVAYLNISYFGDGAYGVGTAAQHYFGKAVSDLSVAEAATLVGLVQNPSGYDPTDYPERATTRRDTVLFKMRSLDKIDQATYEAATAGPLALNVTDTPNGCTSSRYPYFCQWVRQSLASDPAFGETEAQRNEMLYRGGLTIRTTLVPGAQDAAQAAVDDALGRGNRVAASAVTVQPGTGHVVAMASNRTWGAPADQNDFEHTEVILPLVPVQPGSNFKPITLAAALEQGLDPNDSIYAPATYRPGGGLSAPSGGFSNFGSAATGNLTAAQAIARSSNTWFIKAEEEVGVLNVAAMAERLGVTSIPRTGERAITAADASLTLGTFEISPVELAGAYATFAAEGVHCRPVPIAAVTDRDGNDVGTPATNCHEAISPAVANTVSNLMTETIDGADPARTGSAQSIGRPAAGKTGTTNGNAAVWFSGFTPQFATAVHVGDPRGGFRYPLRNFRTRTSYVAQAYGGLVAGPIWRDLMLDLHRGVPVRTFPAPTEIAVAALPVVPDVRGLTVSQAVRALEDAGYTVEGPAAVATTSTAGPVPEGVVVATAPAAGTAAPSGATVTLTGSNLSTP